MVRRGCPSLSWPWLWLLLFSFLKLVEISQDSWLARGGRASYSLFLFIGRREPCRFEHRTPDASFSRVSRFNDAVLILAFPLATAIYLS